MEYLVLASLLISKSAATGTARMTRPGASEAEVSPDRPGFAIKRSQRRTGSLIEAHTANIDCESLTQARRYSQLQGITG